MSEPTLLEPRIDERESLNPSSGALSATALRRRARMGAWILGARSVLQQLTVLAGNVYLARQLTPAEFGLFVVVQFALAFFSVLGDAGIAPALIQQREAPSSAQLATVWWLQLGVSLTVMALLLLTAPIVERLWPESSGGVAPLLRAGSLTLVLTALRVVPAVMLERELRFAALSVVEFIGTVVFYATAAVLARAGFGIYALVWSMIAQSAVSAVALNLAKPYVPRMSFALDHVRAMLRYGLAYQGKTLVNFANSAVTPVIGGALLGNHLLGLNNFAQNLAYFPLMLVNILSRVAFPLYSRLQDDPDALADEISRSLRVCGSATLLFVGLCFGLAPKIVAIVYGDKWLPSVPLVYIYAALITVGFLSPVLAAAFDATGRPQVMLRMATAWTVLNWCCVLLGTAFFTSVTSFALAYGVHVVVGNCALLYVARRIAPRLKIIRPVIPSAVGAAASAGLGHFVLSRWVDGVLPLIGSIFASAVLFAIVNALLDRTWLAAVLRFVRPAKNQAGVPTSAA